MKSTEEVFTKVKLMRDCEPSKLTMAVAMLERANLAEKTSINEIVEKKHSFDVRPCSRLSLDDFIFYTSMLGYNIDEMSDEDFNKCKARFIKNLQVEITSLREIIA